MLNIEANTTNGDPLGLWKRLPPVLFFTAALIASIWAFNATTVPASCGPLPKAMLGNTAAGIAGTPVRNKADDNQIHMSRTADSEIIEFDPKLWKVKAPIVPTRLVFTEVMVPGHTDTVQRYLCLYLLHHTLLC